MCHMLRAINIFASLCLAPALCSKTINNSAFVAKHFGARFNLPRASRVGTTRLLTIDNVNEH